MTRKTQQQKSQHKMSKQATIAAFAIAVATSMGGTESFAFRTSLNSSSRGSSSMLQMGLFDKFVAGGTGKDDLDDEFAKQQAILAQRRAPKAERDKYFENVEARRKRADDERNRNWSWQTKQYKKGEDPIDEWRKRREDGTISDLDNQYGDPKKIGGIPLPMASFGVGGEFGVGGKVSSMRIQIVDLRILFQYPINSFSNDRTLYLQHHYPLGTPLFSFIRGVLNFVSIASTNAIFIAFNYSPSQYWIIHLLIELN